MKPAPLPIIRPALPGLDELAKDLRQILESGQITCGRYTRLLEEEAARQTGAADAVAVSSCTSGLMLALRALELGGPVMVPAFTFAASAHAVAWNGLEIVFTDVDLATGNVGRAQLEAAWRPGVAAAMPVYIFGLAPEWSEIRAFASERGLKLVADAAQALGSSHRGRPAGGFADLEVFSLSPTKVVSAVEGGLVVTSDAALGRRLRALRDYGKGPDGSDMLAVGLSARMSELHALVGLRNLERWRALVDERQALLERYRSGLADLAGIRFQLIAPHQRTSGNYAIIFVSEEAGRSRDELIAGLAEAGIQTKPYFHPPAHRLSCYREAHGQLELPVAERLAREGLALPLHNGLAEADVDRVVGELRRLLGG